MADGANSTTIGSFLGRLRSARQMGVAALAKASGVHRATVYRWEAGERQPCLAELETVLQALGASQKDKQKALRLLDAPRACARLRAEVKRIAQVSDLGPLPTGGNLLRAMRMRKRRSLSEVAAHLGISSRTLRYWENAEYWPSQEQLHALCYYLEATEEELVALTVGPLPLVRDKSERLLSEEELLDKLSQMRTVPSNPRLAALKDLTYLTFEAQAWQWAVRHDAGRVILSLVCAQYANYLFMDLRNAESHDYVNRALDSLGEVKPQVDFYLWAVVRKASLLGAGDDKSGAARAVKWLREWLPEAQSLEMRAWMLSDLAHYLFITGDTEQAVATGSEGMRIAETRFANRSEAAWRKRHYARLLAQAGLPEEALAQWAVGVETPAAPGSTEAVSEGLTHVEIAMAQKDIPRAHTWLQNTYVLCEAMTQNGTDGVPYCYQAADSLRGQLTTTS